MEVIEKVKTNCIMVDSQPEFVSGAEESVSANFFVLCEDVLAENLQKNIYEYEICGESLIDWVQRACITRPMVLRCTDEDEIISLIRPYISNAEYSVVLFANTPLVNKQHLIDLLSFVKVKHMSACKLKKGYIFRNEYIQTVNEIFSVDEYDFSSGDFYEVTDLKSLDVAREVLLCRLVDFYNQKGIVFENSNNISIDANSEIGYFSKIGNNVSIINKSKVGTNCEILTNSTISNSKIDDDIIIGAGAIIENSVIKQGAQIGFGSVIKNSVIGENVSVGSSSKILKSKIEDEAVVEDFVTTVRVQVGKNAKVCSGARVVAGENAILIEENSTINANAKF